MEVDGKEREGPIGNQPGGTHLGEFFPHLLIFSPPPSIIWTLGREREGAIHHYGLLSALHVGVTFLQSWLPRRTPLSLADSTIYLIGWGKPKEM